MSRNPFAPRFALVTGASAGIGRELARRLALDRGATVLATARRADRLADLAAGLPPGAIRVLPGDLANPDFRARLWAWAVEQSGGQLDLLINNAGVGAYADLLDHDFVSIRHLFEVNVFAPIDLTQRAGRLMRARGSGQVVQISSTVGSVGMPYAAAYVATKHALDGLTKTVRYELRGTGVRVWAACPGRVRTEFRAAALGPGVPDRAGQGEPVERVVRGILRGLDRRSGFVYPTRTARAIVGLARWLPGPFEWFMMRWAPGHFAREIGRSAP